MCGIFLQHTRVNTRSHHSEALKDFTVSVEMKELSRKDSVTRGVQMNHKMNFIPQKCYVTVKLANRNYAVARCMSYNDRTD